MYSKSRKRHRSRFVASPLMPRNVDKFASSFSLRSFRYKQRLYIIHSRISSNRLHKSGRKNCHENLPRIFRKVVKSTFKVVRRTSISNKLLHIILSKLSRMYISVLRMRAYLIKLNSMFDGHLFGRNKLSDAIRSCNLETPVCKLVDLSADIKAIYLQRERLSRSIVDLATRYR